jgi:hypothetical protein
VKIVAGWVFALLVVIGAGVAVEAAVGVSAYHPASALAARIDQLAVNAAVAFGDANVSSVTWVESNRLKAALIVSDTTMGGRSEPVYVIEMRGRFACHCGNPGLQRASQSTDYSVIALFFDVATMRGIGASESNRWVPLTSLGTPETDSLVALGPHFTTGRRRGISTQALP